MMTLGRLAALTASVEHSTEQRESERRLTERVELTRDLHETAIQSLFGVALALGSDEDLTKQERQRCQEELRSVVADLRRALTRPLETPERPAKACLGELLDRLTARRPELRVDWADGVEVPADLEPVAQLVLNEALRNADRHAKATEIVVRIASDGETFTLAIENDGAGDGRTTRGSGLGLRLAALEALRYEGLVEFGSFDGDHWRVRLVVPVGALSAEPRGLRVLVVDDHDVVQWGFRLLLERQPWVERCLAASTGAEAVDACRKVQPEVALVDMLLGTESGAEVCEEIHQVSPGTRVLLISGAGIISPNVARTAGAAGFISKDWSAVDVVRAVRRVSQGQEVFAEAPLDSPLSEREQEVLPLIATGSTNKRSPSRCTSRRTP